MPHLHVSTDNSLLDIGLIHRTLSQDTDWAKDIPLALVQRAIDHSLCFGGFVDGQQVAFARVISDYATLGTWAMCSCCRSTAAAATARR